MITHNYHDIFVRLCAPPPPHRSCAEVQTQHVTVDPAAVEAVASALVSEEVHLAAANQRGTRLPVRFDSVEDEVRSVLATLQTCAI